LKPAGGDESPIKFKHHCAKAGIGALMCRRLVRPESKKSAFVNFASGWSLPPLRSQRAGRETVLRMRSKPVDKN
jgi:hypothetical protein